jgi:signal transduction histidine kinase
VAQEVLSNIVRHARATAITVRFQQNEQRATLSIADNGQGFDAALMREGRYGLLGLQERVKLLNGQLSLQSQPGEGTQIEVTLPLTH